MTFCGFKRFRVRLDAKSYKQLHAQFSIETVGAANIAELKRISRFITFESVAFWAVMRKRISYRYAPDAINSSIDERPAGDTTSDQA